MKTLSIAILTVSSFFHFFLLYLSYLVLIKIDLMYFIIAALVIAVGELAVVLISILCMKVADIDERQKKLQQAEKE